MRVVDEHGELHGTCPGCAGLQQQLAGAEKEIRAWRTRYANLAADRDAKARDNQLWGHAVSLFTEWKIATDHMRSGWTADRFWLCEPYLRTEGFVLCRWAVWGVAFDPMFRTLPNGHIERFDAWETCFKSRGNFERYVVRGHANPEARRLFADREKSEKASVK